MNKAHSTIREQTHYCTMEFLHDLEFVYKYVFRNSQYRNPRNKLETLVL